ncbi:DNA mismatch repair protein MutT [Planomonospora venezuelensis]|nr:DNA mismatch repair protein MutT [Planomonospora venezuelensis]
MVVGALVREDRVLLVHRSPSKRAHPGRWDLPGGVVEDGESEMGALARELREELGVQVATGSTSHLCRVTVRPAGEPVLLSAWLVRDWTGVPTNAAPEEHDDIRWFGLAAMQSLPYEAVQAALVRAVQRRRRLPDSPLSGRNTFG